MDGHGFADALKSLEEGLPVRRQEWREKATLYLFEDDEERTLYFDCGFWRHVWIPTQYEILARDWGPGEWPEDRD